MHICVLQLLLASSATRILVMFKRVTNVLDGALLHRDPHAEYRSFINDNEKLTSKGTHKV